MGSARNRQLRRERKAADRRRGRKEIAARQTQQQQAEAAAKLDLAARTRRHRTAWAMWVVAAVMAIAHFFEHFGVIRLMSAGWQDFLLGWPMAGALAVLAAVIYGT